MMSGQEEPKRIGIRYVKDKDYRVVPATDVYGGLTPRGQIVAHFMIDCASIPEGVKHHELLEDGRLGASLDDESLPIVERMLQVGVMMSPDCAERIGEWLLMHARVLQAASDTESEVEETEVPEEAEEVSDEHGDIQ